jgi:DNA-binding transcriptional regulator YdaS (Cro superfamily)
MIKLTIKEIQEIKDAFKGIDRTWLADMLDCPRNLIDQYAGTFKVVSPGRARKIEILTKSKIKAETLRPDIFKKDE